MTIIRAPAPAQWGNLKLKVMQRLLPILVEGAAVGSQPLPDLYVSGIS